MDLQELDGKWFEEKAVSGAPPEEFIPALSKWAEAGNVDEAVEWARFYLAERMEAGDAEAALSVLEWLVTEQDAVEDPAGAVEKIFARNRSARKLIGPAGFGEKPPAEAFRRLRFLRSLKPGLLCYHPTWGFGVIEDVDTFYQKVEIDFERKGSHELAFSYAADALELLDDDHILALRHREPETLQRLVDEDPAEVVRLALRSYGPMPVPRLQERLVPAVVPEAKWKNFWAAARAAFKEDGTVEIPRKRSENLILRDKALDYDDEWFAVLRRERDIERLLERFQEILDKEIDTSSPTAREVLADRLAFIIRGAPSAHPEWKADGLVFARLLGIEPAGIEKTSLLKELADGKLARVLEHLPARRLQAFLEFLLEQDREKAVSLLAEEIPGMGYTVLAEVISALENAGAEGEVRELFSTALARRTATPPMLLWCLRFPEKVREWNLIDESDLAFRVLEAVESPATGAVLRAQNQLRERFQQEAWLHGVLEKMPPRRRRDLLRRIMEGRGWNTLDRNALIASVLRRFPELKEVLSSASAREEGEKKKTRPLLTSVRSYEARRRKLEHLLTVEIPENSREIELARSYGDLRENAEYKYAKEKQGLLMAQADQLAADLEKVRQTDFSGVSLDEAGMGTGVELVFDDGSVETYYILGVWDQDEELGIISSQTALAEAVLGHRPGDEIDLPGGRKARLRAVLPLSPEVRAWLATEPEESSRDT